VTPDTVSIVPNSGVNQAQVVLFPLAPGSILGSGCIPNRIGVQINLPANTLADTVSFDRVVDSTVGPSGPQAIHVNLIARNGSDIVAFSDLPTGINGTTWTFNLHSADQIAALNGATMTKVQIHVGRQSSSQDGGQVRLFNFRVNGNLI